MSESPKLGQPVWAVQIEQWPKSDNVQVANCLHYPNMDNLSGLSKKLSALPKLRQPVLARQCLCWTQTTCPAWTMPMLKIFLLAGGGGVTQTMSDLDIV